MVIRPKLTYGALAWGIYLSTRNLKQLNRIQHLISILITNAHQSTAQEVLEIILDLDPISRILEKTALTRARAITIKAENHYTRLKITQLTETILQTRKRYPLNLKTY